MNLLIKIAFAAEGRFLGGIAPGCSPVGDLVAGDFTNKCGFTDLLKMGSNLVLGVIELTFLIAAFMLAFGGIKLIINSANPSKRAGALETIKAAVIGLLIVLLAWVAMNFLLSVFTGCSGWEVFGTIKCEK